MKDQDIDVIFLVIDGHWCWDLQSLDLATQVDPETMSAGKPAEGMNLCRESQILP